MFCVLVSYAYMKKHRAFYTLIEHLGDDVDILMDSGAFTAYHQGVDIELDEYIDVCQRLEPKLWDYIQLDVLMDKKRTAANLDAMAKAGLSPMPVVTYDEDTSAIRRMLKVNKRIGVSGGASNEDIYYSARLEQFYRASGNKAELHGLAYTRGLKVLKSCVRSIDSSSWMANARYGNFQFFDRMRGIPNIGQYKKLRKRSFLELPVAMRDYFIRCGITCEEFADFELNRGVMSLLSFCGVHAWTQYARLCHSRGVRMFFVIPNTNWCPPLALMAHHDHGDYFDWKSCLADRDRIRELAKTDMKAFCEYWKEGLGRSIWNTEASSS